MNNGEAHQGINHQSHHKGITEEGRHEGRNVRGSWSLNESEERVTRENDVRDQEKKSARLCVVVSWIKRSVNLTRTD